MPLRHRLTRIRGRARGGRCLLGTRPGTGEVLAAPGRDPVGPTFGSGGCESLRSVWRVLSPDSRRTSSLERNFTRVFLEEGAGTRREARGTAATRSARRSNRGSRHTSEAECTSTCFGIAASAFTLAKPPKRVAAFADISRSTGSVASRGLMFIKRRVVAHYPRLSALQSTDFNQLATSFGRNERSGRGSASCVEFTDGSKTTLRACSDFAVARPNGRLQSTAPGAILTPGLKGRTDLSEIELAHGDFRQI
jgi:hypothetical protein